MFETVRCHGLAQMLFELLQEKMLPNSSPRCKTIQRLLIYISVCVFQRMHNNITVFQNATIKAQCCDTEMISDGNTLALNRDVLNYKFTKSHIITVHLVSQSQTLRMMTESLDSIAAIIGQGPPNRPSDHNVILSITVHFIQHPV